MTVTFIAASVKWIGMVAASIALAPTPGPLPTPPSGNSCEGAIYHSHFEDPEYDYWVILCSELNCSEGCTVGQTTDHLGSDGVACNLCSEGQIPRCCHVVMVPVNGGWASSHSGGCGLPCGGSGPCTLKYVLNYEDEMGGYVESWVSTCTPAGP